MDKDTKRLGEKIIKALERNAKATEDMLAIATREEMTFEQGPPVCPGCGTMNPVVTQVHDSAETASGPLGEFVLIAETHCCNRQVYAIPTGLNVVADKRTAIAMLNEKKGGSAS